MLLSVEGLNSFYGEAIHALRDVSFGVAEGEIAPSSAPMARANPP